MSSIPEQRFREASGERYLKTTGGIRCHALAKSRIRKWREDFNDYDTPTEELWPECQCHKPAAEGLFVCEYHGGATPRLTNPPRSILDVMPVDMAQKYQQLMEHPDYISRKNDIILFQTRQWELLEELQVEAGSDEAWGTVHEALVKLRKGDVITGISMLEDALDTTNRKKEIWQELTKVENVLSDLTNTQMKTAKELRLWVSQEQVLALINNIRGILTDTVENYIDDPSRRNDYKQRVINEIQLLMNATPQALIVDAT